MRLSVGVILALAGCGVDYDIAREEFNLGGDDEEEPAAPESGLVADCAVSPNPIEPPFEVATWDGSGSVDNDGREIVSYTWALISKPEGSAAELPSTDGAVITGFMPDLAGDYVAELTIANDAGLTASCQATLESIPAQNLWIEMSWETSFDDMDLHLLRPGGILETSGDCFYANCDSSNPEISPLRWGDASTTDDDPSLDLDDIYNNGPENINITEPYAGIYTVVVHDYYHQGFEDDYWGNNFVTVNIYIDGQLEWSDTKAIAGEDEYVYFAEIDWNTGTVYGL